MCARHGQTGMATSTCVLGIVRLGWQQVHRHSETGMAASMCVLGIVRLGWQPVRHVCARHSSGVCTYTSVVPSASDTAEYHCHINFIKRSYQSKKWSQSSMFCLQPNCIAIG